MHMQEPESLSHLLGQKSAEKPKLEAQTEDAQNDFKIDYAKLDMKNEKLKAEKREL